MTAKIIVTLVEPRQWIRLPVEGGEGNLGRAMRISAAIQVSSVAAAAVEVEAAAVEVMSTAAIGTATTEVS